MKARKPGCLQKRRFLFSAKFRRENPMARQFLAKQERSS